MKIGEDTTIKIDLKTIVAIIMITSTFVRDVLYTTSGYRSSQK